MRGLSACSTTPRSKATYSTDGLCPNSYECIYERYTFNRPNISKCDEVSAMTDRTCIICRDEMILHEAGADGPNTTEKGCLVATFSISTVFARGLSANRVAPHVVGRSWKPPPHGQELGRPVPAINARRGFCQPQLNCAMSSQTIVTLSRNNATDQAEVAWYLISMRRTAEKFHASFALP